MGKCQYILYINVYCTVGIVCKNEKLQKKYKDIALAIVQSHKYQNGALIAIFKVLLCNNRVILQIMINICPIIL